MRLWYKCNKSRLTEAPRVMQNIKTPPKPFYPDTSPLLSGTDMPVGHNCARMRESEYVLDQEAWRAPTDLSSREQWPTGFIPLLLPEHQCSFRRDRIGPQREQSLQPTPSLPGEKTAHCSWCSPYTPVMNRMPSPRRLLTVQIHSCIIPPCFQSTSLSYLQPKYSQLSIPNSRLHHLMAIKCPRGIKKAITKTYFQALVKIIPRRLWNS